MQDGQKRKTPICSSRTQMHALSQDKIFDRRGEILILPDVACKDNELSQTFKTKSNICNLQKESFMVMLLDPMTS